MVSGHLVADIITDPSHRDFPACAGSLWMLLTLWVIRAIMQWFQARLGQHGASAAIADISGEVLRKVTASSGHHLVHRRDAAVTLVTSGLDALRPYFTAYLPALVLATILTPATVVVIACNDIRSAGLVLVALPLIPIFMMLIGITTAQRSAAALTAMTTLQARLMDLIAGIPTLRALGRADGPADRIDSLSASHRRSAMATLRIAFLSALVMELIATLGVALVAVSIGLRLAFGEMTLATGLTVLLLAPEVFWPLRRVGVEFHAAQDGVAAFRKAAELMEISPLAPNGIHVVDALGATIRLECLSVDGRDGHSPYALSGILHPGCVNLLTGPNGAGKSTVLQVIAGLTAPSEGRVTVDGVDVTELDLESWWRQLSWLAQRPLLIPGTVADNLALFGPLVDIESACRAACFDEVVDDLPNGLDTVLGRGGVGLSLGQRQRLAIARALGSGAAVLLLDEPTSHLDIATESAVLEALSKRAKDGTTVVVVSHRDRFATIADRVIRVEAAPNVRV
jgi:ATP-binding cassette subfamily C protein CydD